MMTKAKAVTQAKGSGEEGKKIGAGLEKEP